MLVSRLRISRTTSPVLAMPASSNRRRRLAAALPVLSSISSSARRGAPKASKFLAFRVVLGGIDASVSRPKNHLSLWSSIPEPNQHVDKACNEGPALVTFAVGNLVHGGEVERPRFDGTQL